MNRSIEDHAAEEIGGADVVVSPEALHVQEDGGDYTQVETLTEEISALEEVERAEGSPTMILVWLTEPETGQAGYQEAAQQDITGLVEQLIQDRIIETPVGDPEDISWTTSPDGAPMVAGLEVATGQQYIEMWVQTRSGNAEVLGLIISGFGAIAVFVAALVIANTFQVMIASRQKTIGLLRAIGATAGQLRRATLAEGAVLGLVSGIAGVLLGWAAGVGMTSLGDIIFGVEMATAMLTPAPAVIGVGLGLGMTLLGSLWPALRAGRISPMEALRPADVAGVQHRRPWARAAIGAVLVLGGSALVAYAGLSGGTFDQVTGLALPIIGLVGGFAGFLGVLLLARLIIPPLVARLGTALSRVAPGLSVTASLAGKNARQVPGRTTATASALLIGVTLVVTVTVGAATAQNFIEDQFTAVELIDQVLGIALLLLAASVLVAFIGVSNTLSLSVMERRREAALLRALGMPRSAVGSMVSVEALLLTLAALILGTTLGLFYGWAGVNALIALDGVDAHLAIPWARLAGIWLVAFGAALAAAWLPARSLSRTPPAAGLNQTA
ncbi:FtsX-like permease family protein [Nesterenkonia populi]